MESAFEGHLHRPKSSEINDAYFHMDTSHAAPGTFQTASELDFIHLGYEVLSINALGSNAVPGFLNVRCHTQHSKNVSYEQSMGCIVRVSSPVKMDKVELREHGLDA
jgi:hypothetical protein